MENGNCATALSSALWAEKFNKLNITTPETFEELSPSDMEEIKGFFSGRYNKLEEVKSFFETRFTDQKLSRCIGDERKNEFYILRTPEKKYIFELKYVYCFEKGRQEFKSVYTYQSGNSTQKRELPVYNIYDLIGYVECKGYYLSKGMIGTFITEAKNDYQLDNLNIFGWNKDGQIIFIPITWRHGCVGDFHHEDGEKVIAEKISEEQYKNILDAFDLVKG